MVLTDGLTNFWICGESSGTRSDSVGGLHFSTVLNSNPAIYFDRSAEGRVGMGIDWYNQWATNNDGVGISLKAASWASPALITINFWYKGGTKPVSGIGLLDNTDTYVFANGAIRVGIDQVAGSYNKKILWSTLGATGGTHNLLTSAAQPTGRWEMMTLTYNNVDKAKVIYVNNGSVGSGTASHGNDLSSTSYNLRLGATYSDLCRAPCGFQQVGIWNRVLTAPEITQLYNNSAGLAYPFFDGKALKFRS